jgi:hypothetical protein
MQNIGSDVARGQNRVRNIFRKDAKAAEKNKSNSELGVLSALAEKCPGPRRFSIAKKLA